MSMTLTTFLQSNVGESFERKYSVIMFYQMKTNVVPIVSGKPRMKKLVLPFWNKWKKQKRGLKHFLNPAV